ncbi:hypothetical protein ACG3SL_12135 [Sphingomonas sp. CJ20]
MSYDQRPGKLRVVQDTTKAPTGGADAATSTPQDAAAAAGAPGGAPAAAPAKGGLPILAALLFLLACVAGGVGFALLQPFATH